jgi:hypothetical protein
LEERDLKLALPSPLDKFHRLVLALCLIAACGSQVVPTAVPVFAQSATAALSGVIVDDKGAVISDAEVTLTSAATKSVRQAVTGSDGRSTTSTST